MANSIPNKRKIISRIHKLQGQLKAIEEGVQNDDEFFKLLQQIGSIKGGAHGLYSEIIEAHIDEYFLNASTQSKREKEAKTIASLLKSYIK